MGRCTPRSGLIIVIGIAVYAHTHSLSLTEGQDCVVRGTIGWPDVHHRHECRYRYR